MKSRERVLLAMNLHKGDRVPLMCQFSIGFMMNQLQPDPVQFWYDGKTYESQKLRFHILDRVGGGDAFVSGIIYALMNEYKPCLLYTS